MVACNATVANYFIVQQPSPRPASSQLAQFASPLRFFVRSLSFYLWLFQARGGVTFVIIRVVQTDWCNSRSCYKSANFCQVQLHLVPALSVGLVLIRSSAPTTIHRGFHVRWWRLAVSALCTAFQLGSQTCCASSPWTLPSDRSAISLTGPLRWQNCRAAFPEPISSFRFSSSNFVETLLPVA